MPEYKALTVSVENSVAHVQLSRPEAFNTMNNEFWVDLPRVFRDLDAGGEVRAVVLSSTGKHFSAGMDFTVFTSGLGSLMGNPNTSRYAEMFRRLVFELQEVFNIIERARFPVLAAVHGGCIGGALDLIASCDCRYATEDAFFSIKETQLGMTADVGSLQRLPHIMPHGLVREMAYTGNSISARRAKEAGLINEVYPDQAAMLEGVMQIARDIAKNSPLAVHGSKEMITYARDHSVADALNFIATWQAGLFSPQDMQEVFMAKAEKREPQFAALENLAPKMTSKE
jgi:enoyl-CoA hydratase